MPENKILASLIIPTLERKEVVFNLACQLLTQAYENFEIIIIDQSRKENELIKKLAVGSGDKVRYYRLEKEGTCLAKNYGLKKARGEFIIFLDDDVEIEDKDFIKHHIANYLDPAVGGVGGKVIDKNLKLNKEQGGPVCRVSKTGRVFPSTDSDEKQEINAPRGGNVSYRREILAAVGGFDERFIGNPMREETDLSLRVFRAGHKIIFEPKAVLVHLALKRGGSRKKDRLDWYFDFFHNEMFFFLKHFPRRYLPILFFRKLRPIIACLVWYGRFKPKALITPFLGFRAGFRSYKSGSPKFKIQSSK